MVMYFRKGVVERIRHQAPPGTSASIFDPATRHLIRKVRTQVPGIIVELHTEDEQIVPQENPHRKPMTDERIEQISQFAARNVVRALKARRAEMLAESDG